jgi:hypothetical protein
VTDPTEPQQTTVPVPHDLLGATDGHPDKPTTLQLVQAEVEQETPKSPLDGLPPGTVLVPLGDTEVTVLPDSMWPNSANEDMITGLYGRWAQKALGRDEDVDAWFEMDVDNATVTQFFIDWAKATGRSPKANSKRGRGSLRTA